MSDVNKGLYKKYEITKISNPSKRVDAIVLEFDDPLARMALRKYATIVRANGFAELANDIISRCNEYQRCVSSSIGADSELCKINPFLGKLDGYGEI